MQLGNVAYLATKIGGADWDRTSNLVLMKQYFQCELDIRRHTLDCFLPKFVAP